MVTGFLDYTAIVKLHLGPLTISPHGMGIALGFTAGAYLMLPAARRRGITDVQVWSMLTRAGIGAIIGARVAYVVNHFGDYTNPIDWLRVWAGGISLLGGIAGAIVAALPVMRRERLRFWTVMDAAAPGLALGIFIGRIGDLIIADHLGKPTHFFLGYECPSVETGSPCRAPVGQAVHQPALYDFVAVGILLIVLLHLRRTRRYDGFLTLAFGAWYGTGRIIEDFFRVDVTHGTGLTGSQWSATAVVVTCLYLLMFVRRTPTRFGLAQPTDGHSNAAVDADSRGG